MQASRKNKTFQIIFLSICFFLLNFFLKILWEKRKNFFYSCSLSYKVYFSCYQKHKWSPFFGSRIESWQQVWRTLHVVHAFIIRSMIIWVANSHWIDAWSFADQLAPQCYSITSVYHVSIRLKTFSGVSSLNFFNRLFCSHNRLIIWFRVNFCLDWNEIVILCGCFRGYSIIWWKMITFSCLFKVSGLYSRNSLLVANKILRHKFYGSVE